LASCAAFSGVSAGPSNRSTPPRNLPSNARILPLRQAFGLGRGAQQRLSAPVRPDASPFGIVADPVTKDWWALTDPCQVPLESRAPGDWWTMMEEEVHND
jgi:hypothetical protein